MPYYKLIWADNFNGIHWRSPMDTGWMLASAPQPFWPGGGMTIAHDIFEHKPNPDGSLREELMAFGATAWIRGEGGYAPWVRNGRDWSYNVGSELADFISYAEQDSEYLPPEDSTRRTKPTPMDEQFLKGIQQAAEYYSDEIVTDEVDEWLERDGAPEEHPRQRFLDSYTTPMLNLLRDGYRWAARRYKAIGPRATTYLFEKVEQEVDRHSEDWVVDYGEMKVYVCISKGEVEVLLPWNDYEPH